MYNHFGKKEIIDEFQTMLKQEPDALNDVNEYLHFVECLHSIENYQESDIDNPESIFTEKIKIVKAYLIKKATEARELQETMEQLTSKLETVTKVLDNIVNKNNTN